VQEGYKSHQQPHRPEVLQHLRLMPPAQSPEQLVLEQDLDFLGTTLTSPSAQKNPFSSSNTHANPEQHFLVMPQGKQWPPSG